MKTPITVLQETMMKLGETPEFECIAESGPQHRALFKYVCRARGETASGSGHSKKDAKQEAARALLARLAAVGAPVPAEWRAGPAPAAPAPVLRCHVALLAELCEEYRLPAVEYELVGDTGPPHMRLFTMRAAVGSQERAASAASKKAARQLAAEALYSHLRANLRRAADFVEEEALVRAHERAMERYRETREDAPQRPNLAQRPADYHLALREQLDAETAALAAGAGRPPEVVLAAACGALRLQAEWAELQPLHTVTLQPAAPPLTFAGHTRDAAAVAAARYLRRALAN